MIQRFHSLVGSLQKHLCLVFFLVQKLDLDDGGEMLLEKAAFPAGLPLCCIGRIAQPAFKVPSEHKEKWHQGQHHAGKLEVQHQHGPDNEDGIESGLESVGHKARTELSDLVNVLFQTV